MCHWHNTRLDPNGVRPFLLYGVQMAFLNNKILSTCIGISLMYASFMFVDQLAPVATERISKIRDLEKHCADLQMQLDSSISAHIGCENNLYDRTSALACWQTEFSLRGCEQYPDEQHDWYIQRRQANCKK